VISARTIIINRVFASEYCVNDTKEQERKRREPGREASGDNEITIR